ncbi:MAG: hypothetical protein H0W64_04385 [Gammaproteobacteria bacterium]|nr:hypothetical protein [Gammaproteobacteria bacterium]
MIDDDDFNESFENTYKKMADTAQRLSHNPVGVVTCPFWLPVLGLGFAGVGVTHALAFLGAIPILLTERAVDKLKIKIADHQAKPADQHHRHIHRFFGSKEKNTIRSEPVHSSVNGSRP